MSTPRSLLAVLDDAINPIVVKEARQAVRSKAVIAVMMLMLVLLLVIVIFTTLAAVDDDFSSRGFNMFAAFNTIVLSLAAGFTPIYAAARLAGERTGPAADLLYTTTIKPASVVWGKLATALILALLFLCASLPFLTLAFLYRGIDLPTIAFFIGIDLVIILSTLAVGLFIAAMPVTTVLRIGIGIAAAVPLAWAAWAVFVVLTDGSTNFSISQFTRDEWSATIAASAAALLAAGLLFVLSVALATPVARSRAALVRAYLLFAWAASLAGFLYLSVRFQDAEAMLFWTFAWTVLSAGVLVIASGGRRRYNQRLRRRATPNIPIRAARFLFTSGATSGIVFALALAGLTLAAGLAAWFLREPLLGIDATYGWNLDSSNELALDLIPIPLFVLAYTLLAVLVVDVILPRRPTRWATPGVAILICGLVSTLPTMLAIALNPDHWGRQEWMYYLNPFGALFIQGEPQATLTTSLGISGAAVVLLLGLTAPWHLTQWRDFKPIANAQPNTPNLPATADRTSSHDDATPQPDHTHEPRHAD